MGETRNKPPEHITQDQKRTKRGLCSGVFELFHHFNRMLCEFKENNPKNMTR